LKLKQNLLKSLRPIDLHNWSRQPPPKEKFHHLKLKLKQNLLKSLTQRDSTTGAGDYHPKRNSIAPN
jgi:hypothetical protein